jgi:hypothetical protein
MVLPLDGDRVEAKRCRLGSGLCLPRKNRFDFGKAMDRMIGTGYMIVILGTKKARKLETMKARKHES